MSGIKLTKAQREWLDKLADPATDCQAREAYHSYVPPLILAAHGFASCTKISFARNRYTITPAGHAWLAANPRRKK